MTAGAGEQPVAEVVVRISLGRGHSFTSQRMTLAEGLAVSKALRSHLAELGDLPTLVEFSAEGYPELFVRANRITDVAVQRVGGRRRPTATSGAVAYMDPPASSVMPGVPVLSRDAIAGRVVG